LDGSFGTVARIIKVARACARIVFRLVARHQSIARPGRARSMSTGAKAAIGDAVTLLQRHCRVADK
jgi:hypothetical protein